MLVLKATQLEGIAQGIFEAAGASAEDARIVAHSLVEANLAGVDSHGVLRIPEYVRWMEQKIINLSAKIEVVHETSAMALLDGGWGFGQIVGRKALEIAIEKASGIGVGAVSMRRCGHLGRVGDYPLIAAEKGMAAVMFVNTHGGGKLTAPWGGIDRRLSANPISIAIPRSSGPPILVDISTCAIAEGKVRSLNNRHQELPPNCIIDAQGRPSIKPADFYGPPPGALLPFGGHKGFALGLVTDILAGALSGAGCSNPQTDRVANSFLALVVDIGQFRSRVDFEADVNELLAYVKSSRLAHGFSGIIIPGEPELRERAYREENGIPVDDETWRQICEIGGRYGVAISNT